MNDHTTAIVPLEAWAFQSPLLRREGQLLDIGLLAEALIYYDRVVVVPASDATFGWLSATPPPSDHRINASVKAPRPQFIELVDWFAKRNKFDDLIALLTDGSLQIYHYAFNTLPMFKNGAYSLWNAQDDEQRVGPTFERRILGDRSLQMVIPRARHREKLYRALRDRVIEVHSGEFDPAIENARVDFTAAAPAGGAVQAVVDDVYPLMGMKSPPEIVATATGSRERTNLNWNIDFKQIEGALGPFVPFTPPIALCGIAHGNRLLWSAALASTDLFLPTPISRLVSTKLVDARDRLTRPQETLDQLKAIVEFPDVRTLVNSGTLSFDDVLKLRGRAKPFREWLQTQAERDRDAVIAYHNEVARESGFVHSARSTLKIFGVVGGAMIGAGVAGQTGAVVGAGVGELVQEGVKYLVDVAGKLDENWRPVVFGDWARDYVLRVQTSGRR